MREPSKSIWYHLGYALESARHGAQSAQGIRSAGTVRSAKKAPPARQGRPAKKAPRAGKDRSAERRPVSSTLDQLIADTARPSPSYRPTRWQHRESVSGAEPGGWQIKATHLLECVQGPLLARVDAGAPWGWWSAY